MLVSGLGYLIILSFSWRHSMRFFVMFEIVRNFSYNKCKSELDKVSKSILEKDNWIHTESLELNQWKIMDGLIEYFISLEEKLNYITAQKIMFTIKDFFSKCDQMRIWSHLLKKSWMENFIFLYSAYLYNQILPIFTHLSQKAY